MSEPSEWESGYNQGLSDARLLNRICLDVSASSTEYIRGYIQAWKAYQRGKNAQRVYRQSNRQA